MPLQMYNPSKDGKEESLIINFRNEKRDEGARPAKIFLDFSFLNFGTCVVGV